MKANGFKLDAWLDKKMTALVLKDVHELLEHVGLEINSPELLSELSGHNGVKVKGRRVCYSPELVEKARGQVAREDTNYCMQKPGETEFKALSPFSPFTVVDIDTDQPRPACDRDAADSARLYDALGMHGPVPVHIMEMDQRFVQIHIAKLCCENSRHVGSWSPAYTYDEAVCIRDMFLAAGRPEPYVALQMTHSPLRLDTFFLGILMRARKSANGTRGFTGGGGAMPLPGVSAPASWRSAAAQGLAEALGAWVTVKLIDPAIHPYCSFTTMPADLRTCRGTHRVPEAYAYALFNRYIMSELLGLTEGGTMGPMDNMFMEALQGARLFNAAGAQKDGLSLPQIVIDQERLNYLKAAMRGLEFPEEAGLTRRIVEETFPETSFLMHASTIDAVRNCSWQPEVFAGTVAEEIGAAICGDDRKLIPQAKAIAREKIATHPFRLSDDVQREVDRIYQLGRKTLAV